MCYVLIENGRKFCRGCRQMRPFSAFGNSRYETSGIAPRCRDCTRAYEAANAVRIKANRCAWAAKNKERLRSINEAHRARNPGYAASASRLWRQRHPSHAKIHDHRHRTSPILDFTEDDIAYVGIIRRDPCSYCGGPGGTVDHIVALSGGGDGHAGNLASACKSCNSSKGPRSLILFLVGRAA